MLCTVERRYTVFQFTPDDRLVCVQCSFSVSREDTVKDTQDHTRRACETCGKVDKLFVYALPGIPMSVGNCGTCFEKCAYPYGVAEGNTNYCLGGIDNTAEWWKKSITYKDGRYLTMEEAFSNG